MDSGKFDLNGSIFLIKGVCRAVGGKTVKTEVLTDVATPINSDAGSKRAVTKDVTITIPDAARRATAEKLATAANYICSSKRGRTFPMGGYMVSKGDLVHVRADLERLIETEIEPFNKSSSAANPVMVEARLIAWEIGTKLTPELVQEIQDSILADLNDLRDAVKSGNASLIKAVALRVKNCPDLAMGIVRTALQNAMRDIPAIISECKKAAKEKRAPDVSLGALNQAIGLISDAPDAPAAPPADPPPGPAPVEAPEAAADPMAGAVADLF